MELGLKIQKTNVGIRISILKILCMQILGKTDNLEFFDPNLPKNKFRGWNFKYLNADSESAPPSYHVCQLLVKVDNFEFFGLNLGKLPNYMRYFGSDNVESVADSWVEVEMSCVEMGGAGRSCVEVDGGGCSV